MEEYCRLGNLRLLQIVVGSLEHNVGDTVSQNVVSLIKQFFCLNVVFVQVLAHTYKLCSLSGEYKCFHFSCYY